MVQETKTRGGKEEERAGGANSTTSGGEHMHQPDHVLPGTRNGVLSDLPLRTVVAPIYLSGQCAYHTELSYISTGTFLGTHPDLQTIQSDYTTATSRC